MPSTHINTIFHTQTFPSQPLKFRI